MVIGGILPTAMEASTIKNSSDGLGEDGWLEFRTSFKSNSSMIGLASKSVNASYEDINYAFYCSAGNDNRYGRSDAQVSFLLETCRICSSSIISTNLLSVL